MNTIQNIVNRATSPTPKFFKTLRTIGLVLAGIGGSVIATPAVLPAAIISIAGYLAVAGGVLSAVSQMTVLVEPAPDGRPFDSAQGTQNKDDPESNFGDSETSSE
ncbi:MAG: hypothetical protein ACI7YS_10955 [Flavobacterium sp.]